VERFAPLAEERNIHLVLELPESVSITGDRDRLMQVFRNLVDNIKYTDPGGRVTLSLANEANRDLASVCVSDTGRGIPADDLPRVFERFYRVDKSRSRQVDARQPGVGLGLAIASEIVRARNSRIDVESIPAVGTRFTVTLPRNPSGSGEL